MANNRPSSTNDDPDPINDETTPAYDPHPPLFPALKDLRKNARTPPFPTTTAPW